MATGIHLGRVGGIRLALDWTVLFIFGLVVTNLALVTFPAWHPGWSTALVWGIALAAGVLLLASILAHELAHALVARAFGMPVRSITLFLFGGMTDIEREPNSPRAEALMAVVGPVTSLAIGVLALIGASALVNLGGLDLSDPARAFAQMGPVATLLAWLGPINLLLGLFNLIPGFPLDGGRILRAGLWQVTGSLHRATRWAAFAGRAVAWGLIAAGVLMVFGVWIPFFGTGLGGLWLVLIGWFLHGAATASYRQLVIRDLLEDIPVERFARWPTHAVSPDLDLASLVEAYFPGTDRAFPIVRGRELVGLVTIADIRRIPRAEWPRVRVAEIMVPAERLYRVRPDDDLFTALTTITRHGVGQIPIVADGEFRGFVMREDISRWLSLQLDDSAAEPRRRRREERPRHRKLAEPVDEARP